MPEYERRNTQVVALNPGSLASHQKWAQAAGFPFPIAVDAGSKVAAAYGATKALGGIQRSVFVIDKDGQIAWVREGMPSTEEILAAIDSLNA